MTAPCNAMTEVGSTEVMKGCELSSTERLVIQRAKDLDRVDWLAVEMD